jgi:hypothetical protein
MSVFSPGESVRTNGSEEVSRRQPKRVFRARAGRRSTNSRGPEVERRDGRAKRNARETVRGTGRTAEEGGVRTEGERERSEGRDVSRSEPAGMAMAERRLLNLGKSPPV